MNKDAQDTSHIITIYPQEPQVQLTVENKLIYLEIQELHTKC